ncbi:4-(cytidine 5'-diphospho)-2-C-methyl-D-erythritol kinase [Litorimonas sp. RW-G-Af-16]|uniref:4-(cytidine 5'-diphospho)-2-C-methyl-D-erythritol kinase n=1 Tax=Litorimonas sp. RW-G-Af-16 TaxID=3241168 RepID=UPI00390C5A6A
MARADATTRRDTARAKINLTLHVGRVIKDPHDPFLNYHPLDSLVVFADIGDEIEMFPADKTTLSIDGPFSLGLTVGDDNMILRAIDAANLPPEYITLTKNLPVSAGIGGGSANAAAILRMSGVDDLHIAVGLGADVPVCVLSQTAHMTGIGEDVTLWPDLGQLHAVLVNPGIAVSTAEIFRAFDAQDDIRDTPRPQQLSGSLLERALDGRNDLQPIAIAQAPIIGEVIAALGRQKGCTLARMSGSGATCFGLFESAASACAASKDLQTQHPDWWVMQTVLGDA